LRGTNASHRDLERSGLPQSAERSGIVGDRALSDDMVVIIVQRLAKLAGIEGDFAGHSLIDVDEILVAVIRLATFLGPASCKMNST
jgi:hypothetical protein